MHQSRCVIVVSGELISDQRDRNTDPLAPLHLPHNDVMIKLNLSPGIQV